MTTSLRLAAIAVLLGCSSCAFAASENDWFVPLGPPPKAAPRHINGGESFPPLPLPATPLRRSERKKEPAPPKLIGKVVWGETASFNLGEGAGDTEVSDWNLCPADLQSIMKKSGQVLGVRYGAETVNLSAFDGDPAKMAALYISGTRSLRMDADQLTKLRAYVQRGGTVVFDSVAGSPYFYDSVRAVLDKLFPDEALRTIPKDHPLYHLAADVDKATFPKNSPGDQPLLEGIYVGCRVGVLVSKYGLGCGWDDREVPHLQQAVYYDVDTASRLGVNLVAYVIGYTEVGLEEAKPELFGAADQLAPTDEFVWSQLIHDGHWNVHPGGSAALLRQVNNDLAVRASLKRVAVDPAKDDLAGRHFLYLTGLDDFTFDAKAQANLKRFLNGGGTLLINNGLGLATFDVAVRRELARLLPESRLAPLPADHPLFTAALAVGEVRFTPAVVAAKPDLKQPVFEGLMVGGDLRVIYSPYDLESGWTGCEHPLCRGYERDSAMKLGLNVVVYAATH